MIRSLEPTNDSNNKNALDDITCEGDDVLELDLSTTVRGHDVLHININGVCVVRCCRFNHYEMRLKGMTFKSKGRR